ncbi:thaumatin-like protein 1 [Typha latifolia]|uniref:thaumatin-like protein 1 n=1 Tax=Typha latifolia TaxID=4733 RepID=UPI003C3033F6
MDTFCSSLLNLWLQFLFFFLLREKGVECAKFTFINHCSSTVWPGVLSNAGSSQIPTTGFELSPGASQSFQAPSGWSGRFWARTGCVTEADNRLSCASGDCGSGQVECKGSGATPPATLAEFTLASPSSPSSQDFYDVSLVDGYNLPLIVQASGGAGDCPTTGCLVDLKARCPAELRAGDGCKSACEAFGKPEFCCSGAYANPTTCKPSTYSQLFKSACPKSYSYAFDDPTSTFTCSGGADYSITFCPTPSPSQSHQKSFDSDPPPIPKPATDAVSLADNYWLANLASDAISTKEGVPFLHQLSLMLASTSSLVLLL